MLVRRVAEIRWLVSRGHPAGPLVPSVARCFVVLACVKLRLAIFGLGRTIRWVKRCAASVLANENVSAECVTAYEYAVAMAAALYPGRAMCLERSLALFYLARRAGIPVTYHHGVRPTPFLAHAWVEYCGRVLNDAEEHVNLFQRFPQVSP